MKFVLNKQRGTVVNHPAFGKIKGAVAYEVTDQVANQLKHIINLIVFDDVVPMEKKENDSNISSD